MKKKFAGLYSDGKVVVFATGIYYRKVAFRMAYPIVEKLSWLGPKAFTEKYPHKVTGVILEDS